jgi:type II secretory pathway component PulM
MNPVLIRARQLWQSRLPRERLLLSAAAAVVLVALFWTFALGPAWRLWQQAPGSRLQAEQQRSIMLALQARAQALQKQARIDPAQSRDALSKSVKDLGAQLSSEGQRATVELPRVPIAALAAFWRLPARLLRRNWTCGWSTGFPQLKCTRSCTSWTAASTWR